MNSSTYAARMRYLDADDVDDAVVDYDGLNVYGRDGQKIGDVDGFIVDPDARRANYVVIDSGGWFTSRRLLLPIGHVTIAADRKSLQADVTRDALGRLPNFDEEAFRAFSDDDLRAFERNTVSACCPDEPLENVSDTSWSYDSRRHYSQPEWWQTSRYAPERLRPVDSSSYDARTTAGRAAAPAAVPPVVDAHNRELITAREATSVSSRHEGDDVSPHFDRRAQPGDVLGLETGGETTSIGDTGEDEDKRRREVERDRG